MSDPTIPDQAAGAPVVPGRPAKARSASLWADAWRDLRRNPVFGISMFLISIVGSMAAIPWLWTRKDPRDCDVNFSKLRPSGEHWFGTNELGCDYYAMTIYGARASILVGVLATLGVVLFGGALGMLAAYYGRWIDAAISRLTDIFLGLPFLLGAIVLLSLLQAQSIWAVVLVLVALGWTTVVRILRASVMSTKNMDYVSAARALGASDGRIIFRHILPNAVAPVIVIATIALGSYIAAEATLTYLGVGLQPPTVSWGIMINRGQGWIFEYPHLLLFPCAFLITTVLSFIMLGDALRDALDPKLR